MLSWARANMNAALARPIGPQLASRRFGTSPRARRAARWRGAELALVTMERPERRRVAASDAARFTAVVVLPTPPFWLAIVKTVVGMKSGAVGCDETDPCLEMNPSRSQAPCQPDEI